MYEDIKWTYSLLCDGRPIAQFASAIDAYLLEQAIKNTFKEIKHDYKIVRNDGIPLSGFDF